MAADYVAPIVTVAEARAKLEEAVLGFCDRVLGFHDPLDFNPRPCAGIRATVGLGKSSVARRQFVDLRRRLCEMGAPNRIVVLTPSHDLAEETASTWKDLGARVAVLRGYHREHPVLKAPMCRDTEAVDAAIAAGQEPQGAVCATKDGARCPFFQGCLKQQNRDEVQGADIVVAPYDALYTGFAVDPDTVGLIVIDEGCWARAVRRTEGLTIEGLTTDLADGLGTGMFRKRAAGQTADRMALRQLLQRTLAANGPDAVTKAILRKTGLTADACRDAANLEQRQMKDANLRPGLTGAARKAAFCAARQNERTRNLMALWRTAQEILDGSDETTGRLRVLPPGGDGIHRLAVIGAASLHLNFRDKPILHLDATLRPEIARAILPDLTVTEVEAAAPHMQVRLVTGSFGKSAIVPDDRSSAEESRRRKNNLADCVDHVRWQARRHAPGRVLVITHKAIEETFADIPGVEVAHFNAIAGLDAYGDVAALFVIGRPLPRDTDLLDPCAALMRHAPDGGYTGQLRGVRMRDGSSRAVRAIRHSDEKAEILRAAICDDELIQAIGRGRGVNRTAETPLDVHVMADVALPLVHDSVVAWETVKPDVVQRMLLAGVAVDSPADAAVLHPGLLGNEKQAQKSFERIGFKRQIPISIYRGMSLKSAAYRRPGRGRSWQRAYWLGGDETDVRLHLETTIGALDGWRPSG